ncbi:MAG TPA: hypothetical protein H9821_04550 [Candidatus Rothia avicola]|uniref:Uncharacterized protein n=1 Tax=Candidatus Rothia avicola TaxID=2840478 RepID=A0A9D2CQB8_9MICC|nr:hypothetical protein [Candidatus Rothia avicola]
MAPANAAETAPLTENSQAVQEAEALIQEALTSEGSSPAAIYNDAPEALASENFYDAPASVLSSPWLPAPRALATPALTLTSSQLAANTKASSLPLC